MTEHDWVFKCGFCVNKCGFCLKESSIMLWFNRIYYALHDLQKRCERERRNPSGCQGEGDGGGFTWCRGGGGCGSGVYGGGEAAEATSEGEISMWRRRRCFSPSRETRVGETETGELCPVSGGRGLFHGENWLGRAGVPCRAGFQRCWCCGPWKVSAWALFPGKRPEPGGEMYCQTNPKQHPRVVLALRPGERDRGRRAGTEQIPRPNPATFPACPTRLNPPRWRNPCPLPTSGAEPAAEAGTQRRAGRTKARAHGRSREKANHTLAESTGIS